ncbi:MAG: CAAX prenyl protease-related protein [Terrimicrobiaceae bacterium]|nr:CAAX prenyl protease-related protein [Terrimicrobiaceae bacterium]
MNDPRKALFAHLAPFGLFLLGLALVQLVQRLAGSSHHLLLAEPVYWIYPLQTLACAIALGVFWKEYDFGFRRPVPLAVGVGLAVFVLWVSPQLLFGQPQRLGGFDPSAFAAQPALYWGTVVVRFLRLAIVVPLVEEIFWRGFLQRYLIDERFTSVPFGKYSHLSFWAVAVAFTFEHSQADWPAAFLTGAIYGWVAVRTKSLAACVVAHATTNLALGIYVMLTRQWGYW